MDREITTDRVRPLFYKDYDPERRTGEVSWETYPIESIYKRAKLPSYENQYELQAAINELRQMIYRIEKLEWKENGRMLVRIKYKKGEPVQYGFSKKQAALFNNLIRRKAPLEERIENYQQIAGASIPHLNELQGEQVVLNVGSKEFIHFDKKKEITDK